jgi:hypothetical protein
MLGANDGTADAPIYPTMINRDWFVAMNSSAGWFA